ncbi:MFS transporter [candidate division WOR-3 bacterium]|nr:MFS transporter [candidate division WOR-3 bacterium]
MPTETDRPESPGPAEPAAEPVTPGARPERAFIAGIPLPSTFAAFAHRNFLLYWLGQMVSFTGTWMQNMAKGWLVLRLTDSPFFVGLDSAMVWLPTWLITLPAGALADRFNKRNLMLVTQSALTLLALVLAILTWTRVINIYYLLAISLLTGFVVAVNAPVAQSMVPELVGRRDVLNAIALNSSMFNIARIFGPSLAGVVLTFSGPGTCFGLNAVSFLAIIVALSFIRLQAPARPVSGESLWQRISGGIRFVAGHKDIRLLMLMVAVFSSFGIVYLPLMPVFARDVFHAGPRGYGLMMTAVGVGALAGGLVLATLSRTRHKGRILLFGTAALGALLLAFSQVRALPPAVVLLAIIGTCQATISSLTNTLIQTMAPDHVRGRVMGVFVLCFNGMFPIGSLVAGSIAQKAGAPAAAFAGGCVILVSLTTVSLVRPELLDL